MEKRTKLLLRLFLVAVAFWGGNGVLTLWADASHAKQEADHESRIKHIESAIISQKAEQNSINCRIMDKLDAIATGIGEVKGIQKGIQLQIESYHK